MEIIHSHTSFWTENQYPYIRVIEVSAEEFESLAEKLTRLDIIEWLMWNDHNGVYSDESSLREFGQIMSREEGLEIMFRQAEENRIIKNL